MNDFGVHQENIWKLFVDAERWEEAKIEVEARGGVHPALVFDLDEPGYFHGMVQGFKIAMDFSRPLTKELIREIHDAAVEPVYALALKKKIPVGWRKEPTWFHLLETTSSPEGIRELREKCNDERYVLPEYGNLFQRLISHLPDRALQPLNFSTYPSSYVRFETVPEDLITTAVDHLIKLYREEVKSKDPDQKIRAIARFVQNLDQAHPFFDGNIRTFGILLLNRLLAEQGLPLCCLSNPNCLDGVSLDQLIELLKQGQKNFLMV